MTLFLFDLDGTLLRTDGVGRRAVARALTVHFGRVLPFDEISFSGRTDPAIFRAILRASGVPDDETDAALPDLLRHFEAEMIETITPARVTALDGAADLVHALASRSDVALGLVTGNVEATAYAKLRAIGLDAPFAHGAFGSDHEIRDHLPPIAIERAEAHTRRRFAPDTVVVVGDTEHDVACARTSGLRAVAVATGHFDRAHLEAHAPDVVLDDLRDAAAFIAATLPPR